MAKKKTADKKTAPAKKSAPKSATAKTTKKSTSKGRTSVAQAMVAKSKVEKVETKNRITPKALKIRKPYVILLIVVVVLAVLLVRYRGVFVAAVVNGQPITRLEVVRETEKQAGKQTINNLVRNTLIEQEARRQNVTVSEKEIDDEIKKVESSLSEQGQKLDQVLEMQGLNRNDLRKLIKLDKLVSKMVGKDIKISDEEINTYIENNRESLPQDQTEEQLRKTVSDSLRQQQLNEKVQQWLSDLQAKAKIQYFVQY